MKKNIILASALIGSLFNAQGVQNYKTFGNNFFPQSPNATPFAVTGKYPVNMYKGVPVTNIPLFSTEDGDSNFRMSLDYNVKSVKPSTIPAWVGLGWNLNVGGSITRIVNGGVDEVYQSTIQPYDRFSYLDHYSTLDTPTWNSQQTMGAYHTANLQYNIREFPSVVPDPDEFVLNVAGITGSFYLNEKGKWIGRTREGKTFKVEFAYKYDYVLTEKVIVGTQYAGTLNTYPKRILYGFTITMDDGSKYIFGQDDKAIEFNSTPMGVDTFRPEVMVSSWQITDIQYPDGKSLKFTYERDDKSVFLVNRSSNASWYTQSNSSGNVGNSGSSGDYNSYNSNKLNNVYLKKVEGEDFIVNFNRSLANQKEYEQLDIPYGAWIPPYTHHFSSYWQHKHWYKLDNVTVTDKAGRSIKNIVFNYNNDPTDRLLLNNVNINAIEKYSFNYNSQKLPLYLSDQTDGWGYYNGNNFNQDYFTMYNLPQDQQRNIYVNIYPNYKVPNLSLSKAETLEQITYPTGGVTTFEYELNDYSKYGDKDPAQPLLKIVPTSNQVAGGLRIRKIKSCNENSNCINKTYSYLNDDGITSSGVLPYKPLYVIEGSEPSVNLSFWEFNSNSYQSLKDEDNSVGYSKVTEISDNGGKSETYFTNFDQTDNLDKGGNYYGWYNSALYKQLPYLSFSLMRGKPLREIIYSDINKISETSYLYTQQTDYVKSYSFVSKQFGQAQANGFLTDLGGISFGALLDAHYVNFNTSYLSEKKTTTENVESKEQNFFNYTYNVPTSKWETESDGNIYVTNYKYASDINNQAMLTANMVGVPVSEEVLKNNKVLSKNETVYPTSLPTAQTGNLLQPISELYLDPQNNAASTEITYDKYDTEGNVIQFTTKDDVPVAIIWGYNKTQPIAKIEGATYDQVQPYISAILTAADNDFIPPVSMTSDQTEAAMIVALDTFRKNPALSGFQTTTYSYDPLVGVRSVTPPSGIREVYKYDANSRLERIENVEGKLVKEFNYNYKP
jgi:hypothetical protein